MACHPSSRRMSAAGFHPTLLSDKTSEWIKTKQKNLDLACCLLALVEWQLIRPVYQAIKSRVCFLFSKGSCQRDSKADGLWRLRQEGLWAEVAHLIFLYQNFQMHAHSTNCCAFWVSLSNFSPNINKLISNSPKGSSVNMKERRVNRNLGAQNVIQRI